MARVLSVDGWDSIKTKQDEAQKFFNDVKRRAQSIYDYAKYVSGVDWHGESLLFLAVCYIEYVCTRARAIEPILNLAEGHLADEAFGAAWDMLKKDGLC